MKYYYILLTFILTTTIQLQSSAEGTRELAPNRSITIDGNVTTDIAALNLSHPEYWNFAAWGGTDTTARLFINIQNPETEVIYLGLSQGHLNQTGQNPPSVNFRFRILDPDGNVVYGPVDISPAMANIQSHLQGFTGPTILHGSDGYEAWVIESEDLTSMGNLEAGNYYIEFENTSSADQFLIDFWDISVADLSGANPIEKTGRVWSYNWALFAINDFGFPERPFNGAFYVCAPDNTSTDMTSYITKIDFNDAGFKPAAFNIAFNSYGVVNSGNIETDRRSVRSQNSTTSEYAIYLNDPVDICQTATVGELEIKTLESCGGDFCLITSSTKAGQINLLLDFDGNDGIYTEGTSDVLLSYSIDENEVGEDVCIPWDGLNGEGDRPMGQIPIILNYAQGVFHFPIYDAELMENGFNVFPVRPAGTSSKLYYDDRNIIADNGTGENKITLDGCVVPCHSWTNYTSPTTIGFGNLNTINTWWFSQVQELEANLEMPDNYVCRIEGPDSLCAGETNVLSALIETDPPGGDLPSNIQYSWTGPSIISDPSLPDVLIDQPGEYEVAINFDGMMGDSCELLCTHTIIEKPMEECCVLEISCPDLMFDTLACHSDLPDDPIDYNDLQDLDIEISDPDCITLLIEAEEQDFGGMGCVNSPRRILRTIYVINDVNEDGEYNPGEERESCVFTYFLIDETAPMASFPPDFTVQCASEIDPDITGRPVTDDNCGEPLVNYEDIINGDLACDGSEPLLRIWTVTDNCFELIDTQRIYVFDDQGPDLEFDHPLLDEIDDGGTIEYACNARNDTGWTLPDFGDNPILVNDNCEVLEIEFSDELVAEGNCIEDGFLARYRCTWTAEDACGNSASIHFYLNIIDDVPPVFERTPEDLTIVCGEDIPDADISAIDNCHCCEVEMSMDTEQTSCEEGNAFLRTFTATDLCGNQSTYTQRINLIDDVPPTLTENGDFSFGETKNINCEQGFFYLYDRSAEDVIATDDCGDASISVEVSQLDNGSCGGNLGLWEVVWTARDLCGNTTEEALFVNITDNRAPEVQNYAPHDCNSAPDPDAISFSDNCDARVEYNLTVDTVNHEICDGAYSLIYNYEFWDDCGNTSVASKEYYINPTGEIDLEFVYPNIHSGDTLSIECHNMSEQTLEQLVRLEGECMGEIDLKMINHGPILSTCQGLPALYEWKATSDCGIEQSIFLNILIIDITPPAIENFVNTINISCMEDIPTAEYSLFDCSESSYTVQEEIIPGNCGGNARVQRIITVTDVCGNAKDFGQTINIVDEEGPHMQKPWTICGTLEAGRPSFADNCGGGVRNIELVSRDTISACGENYMSVEEKWRAEDNCGNIRVSNRTLILDNDAPVITYNFPGYDISVNDTNFVQCDFPELQRNHFTVEDYCNLIPFDIHKEVVDGTCEENAYQKVVRVSVSATDHCGMQSDLDLVFAYVDTEAPILNEYPEDVTIACETGEGSDIFAVDDCSGEITPDYRREAIDSSSYREIWTAEDACGNTVEHSRTVTSTADLSCDILGPSEVMCWSNFALTADVIGGTAPYNYEWNIVSGLCEITRSSESDPSINVVILTGEVRVELKVTDANGCETLCSYTVECTRMKKSANFRSIDEGDETLYPNPAQEQVTISSEKGFESLYLVDQAGKEYINKYYSTRHNKENIDISDLANGVYYIIVGDKNSQRSLRLLKSPEVE